MLSIQRQITPSLLLTMSYVGNQGHHLLAVVSTNPSNQALCLSLSQAERSRARQSHLRPVRRGRRITSGTGQVYHGTRVGLGPNYGEMTAQKTIGNSNYNALETNLRYVGKRSDFLLATPTASRSIKVRIWANNSIRSTCALPARFPPGT